MVGWLAGVSENLYRKSSVSESPVSDSLSEYGVSEKSVSERLYRIIPSRHDYIPTGCARFSIREICIGAILHWKVKFWRIYGIFMFFVLKSSTTTEPNRPKSCVTGSSMKSHEQMLWVTLVYQENKFKD